MSICNSIPPMSITLKGLDAILSVADVSTDEIDQAVADFFEIEKTKGLATSIDMAMACGHRLFPDAGVQCSWTREVDRARSSETGVMLLASGSIASPDGRTGSVVLARHPACALWAVMVRMVETERSKRRFHRIDYDGVT